MDAQVLKTIPLSKILKEIGAQSNVDGIKGRWRMDTGDAIQVVEDRWYNWNREQGGTGVISLIKHWLELEHIEPTHIRQQIINILRPIYKEYETLYLKEKLEENLPNNHSVSPKLKV